MVLQRERVEPAVAPGHEQCDEREDRDELRDSLHWELRNHPVPRGIHDAVLRVVAEPLRGCRPDVVWCALAECGAIRGECCGIHGEMLLAFRRPAFGRVVVQRAVEYFAAESFPVRAGVSE